MSEAVEQLLAAVRLVKSVFVNQEQHPFFYDMLDRTIAAVEAELNQKQDIEGTR